MCAHRFKENEFKIYDSLHKNLSLLTKFYPASNEFLQIFKKDMFAKSNKTAFCEVIYYLFNILNPKLTQEKITTWPPYDKSREAKFRSEVLSYVNSLNVIYDNANIPQCQASSLICPGGIRFARLMFKISELVVYEHLRRSGVEDLLLLPYPLKSCPVKLLENQKNSMKLIRQDINEKTKLMQQKLESYQQRSLEQASLIIKKQEILAEDLKKASKTLDEVQQEFNLKYPKFPSLQSLADKLNMLLEKNVSIADLQSVFSENTDILSYLLDSKMSINHQEEDLQIPQDIAHLITNKRVLDLSEYFLGLAKLLEKKCFELRHPATNSMQKTEENIDEMIVELQDLLSFVQLLRDKCKGVANLLD